MTQGATTIEAAASKMKKTGEGPPAISLVENPDILATLSQGEARPRLVVGFAADRERLSGIEFLKQTETPGLGAEIENPRWRESWVGKRLVGDDGTVRFDVAKGVPAADAAEFHVDAISGATLTANGVENMVHFWLGEQGFGPFLARLRDGGA